MNQLSSDRAIAFPIMQIYSGSQLNRVHLLWEVGSQEPEVRSQESGDR
ncbi:MAG TPA: hypothetical protein V6D48_12135 [Oculatellaceae cyanobacterium]